MHYLPFSLFSQTIRSSDNFTQTVNSNVEEKCFQLKLFLPLDIKITVIWRFEATCSVVACAEAASDEPRRSEWPIAPIYMSQSHVSLARGEEGPGDGAYGTCRVQRVVGHEDVRLEGRGGSARIVRIFIKEPRALLQPPSNR